MKISDLLNKVDPALLQQFKLLADEQRGVPESMFIQSHNPGVQNAAGLYQWAMEHTGDLIHRAAQTEVIGWGFEATTEKVRKLYRAAFSPYGFERDIMEQIHSNYRYHQEEGDRLPPLETWIDQVRQAGQRYAQAYRGLRPLTKIQLLGRDAAIALGNWDWDRYRSRLAMLRQIVDDPDRFEMMYFEPLASGERLSRSTSVGPGGPNGALTI